MTVKVDELPIQRAQTAWHEGRLFEALFHDHWERVCAVLYPLVGDRAEAEDLAVETFLRLYRKPPRKMAMPDLAGWLYRVATNLGINALRARQRRARYEREAGQVTLQAAQGEDPAVAAERQEMMARVRRVLHAMDRRDARLLVLRHSGFSYAELASVLRVAPGSIGTMLARAERKFERRYRALEGGE